MNKETQTTIERKFYLAFYLAEGGVLIAFLAWFRIRPFWVTQGARKSPAFEGRISTGNVPCGRRPASPGHARWG